MQHQEPQQPFFRPIRRLHKTEEELNALISVVKIRIWGDYTKRGEHRKEIITGQYDAELEVPENYNIGHVKLAAQRHIKNDLKGIRVRHFYHEKGDKGKPVEYKRKVMDFMSSQGLRDNDSLKREYEREIARRKAEAEQMVAGVAPQFSDDSEYGSDGLPKFSEKTYVAQ